MNSAELPATDRSSEPHWDDVRRIYRRVCLLRATGRHAEALDLEIQDLSRALATARAEATSELHESTVLAEEAERVSNASLLAELVAPILAEKLSLKSPSPAPVSRTTAPSAARPATPAPVIQPATSSPQSIADMIDGMLSQRPALSGSAASR